MGTDISISLRKCQSNLLICYNVWYNIFMKTAFLPAFLQPFFWSYRLADLDIREHQTLIIKQILNHGSLEAIKWLRSTYNESEIQAAIAESMESEWSKKSLTLWSKIYEITPTRQSRFI
jgi:hypothetical protein